MDINRQIDYWQSGATNDIETAELLINNGKNIHGMFFCHLAAEKAIKAQVVLKTKKVPPKSHNLVFLSEKANVKWSEEDNVFLGILMTYQLEGRYPHFSPPSLSKEKALEYLTKTKEIVKWLNNKS